MTFVDGDLTVLCKHAAEFLFPFFTTLSEPLYKPCQDGFTYILARMALSYEDTVGACETIDVDSSLAMPRTDLAHGCINEIGLQGGNQPLRTGFQDNCGQGLFSSGVIPGFEESCPEKRWFVCQKGWFQRHHPTILPLYKCTDVSFAVK